jgi:adenine-specific DNA-methyltransferase
MLVYAKNIDNVTLNTLGIDDKKRKQYQYGDEIGFYKLRGFRRSGNNSLKTQRPGLFYPIYYNEELGLVSLEEKKGYDCILPIDESGTERCWRWGKDTFLEKYNDYIEIKRANGKLDIYVKERETDYIGEKPKTVWNKPEYTGQTGTNEIKKLLGEKCFSYPKSLYAVKDVVRVATNNNDIVLDFFAGSGTTAHSVLDLNDECGGNRQFIICEQMDYIDKVTVERIKKVIENKNQGNFIYFELKKFNQTFIERIEAAKDTETLLQIWEQMKEKSFLAYNVDIKAQESNMDEFMQLDLAQQKSLLCELLDKNQLYVNLSDMSDSRFETTEEEYSVTQAFYSKK